MQWNASPLSFIVLFLLSLHAAEAYSRKFAGRSSNFNTAIEPSFACKEDFRLAAHHVFYFAFKAHDETVSDHLARLTRQHSCIQLKSHNPTVQV